jgi:YD repeat-containing protein
MKMFYALALVLAATAAQAQQTTIRDANGRISTTITRDSNGTQTFRDGNGRMTGTATTNSNGTTTFRDSSGNMTGTAEKRR